MSRILFVCFLWCAVAQANEAASLPPYDSVTESARSIERLRVKRDTLADELAAAPPLSQSGLEAALETVEMSIESAEQRFQELAIGGVDESVFSTEASEFDWRVEVLDTLRPMFDNLKRLTEKPRQITDLRNQIDLFDSQQVAAETALANLTALQHGMAPDGTVAELLDPLARDWRERLDAIEQERELAQVRLARLQDENAHWAEDLSAELKGFATGRGLTLVMALGIVLLSSALLRAVAKLVRGTRLDPTRRKARPAWRLFGFAAQSLLFIAPATLALAVFYLRGDVLLLALAAVLAFFSLLALKDLLPRYIAEARVLLNLGSAREGERVIYNGLPWEIVSLNVHCILRNPALHGSVRLPLGDLVGMVSRPSISDETWFPSATGDILITPDDDIVEVGRQTTDQVELKALAGDVRYVSSARVFDWGARNLSAGESFGVGQTFGLDYGLQTQSLDTVPSALKDGVFDALADAGLQEQVSHVTVELQSAGASSLDYLVYITAHASAARRYYQLQRIAQQACVAVCNRHDWSIPFPQLTVHRASE